MIHRYEFKIFTDFEDVSVINYKFMEKIEIKTLLIKLFSSNYYKMVQMTQKKKEEKINKINH
jgi:hypothetical protein